MSTLTGIEFFKIHSKHEVDIMISQSVKAIFAELLASRRWTIGTIITVGLSLAAYLSALIHFNH